MDTIGSILREAREKQKKSIDDIVETTKITRANLTAIESDSFDFCPGHAYTKAFIKIYAEELSLDAEELAVMYERKMSGESGDGESRKNPSHNDSGFLLKNKWLIFVLIIGVVSGLLFFLGLGGGGDLMNSRGKQSGADKSPESRSLRTRIISEEKAPVTVTETKKDPEPLILKKGRMQKDQKVPAAKRVDPASRILEEGKEKQVDGSVGEEPSVPAAEEPKEFVVRFVARELTWVKLIADGDPSEVMLRAGDTYSKSAVNSMRVRIGNSGGISLFYNDIPLGSPGKPGEPVNLLFPEAAENLKVFE